MTCSRRSALRSSTTSHQQGGSRRARNDIRRMARRWADSPGRPGADRSRFVVAGAVVGGDADSDSRQQILFALSTSGEGVTLSAPMPLVALQSSHTGSVTCENVRIDEKCIIAGPAPNVLAGRKKTVPLGQAFLAMGLCRAGIELIDEHDSDLARQTSAALQKRLADLRDQVLRFCDPAANPEPVRRLWKPAKACKRPGPYASPTPRSRSTKDRPFCRAFRAACWCARSAVPAGLVMSESGDRLLPCMLLASTCGTAGQNAV